MTSDEFIAMALRHLRSLRRRFRQAMGPPTFVPPGHFYSPIVDVGSLKRSAFGPDRMRQEALAIGVDLATMEAFFRRLVPFLPDCTFPDRPDPAKRYFSQNEMYGIGDATVLSAVIRGVRPRRYYEIGCGFSTAVALDAIDASDATPPEIVLVEPDPARLRSLLRPADESRFKLLARAAQETDPEMYRALEADDVLFIDSTHVSKTGSDVNFELFEILPRLNSGVLVHFHDIFPAWEYPAAWVFEDNRSWNEIYILRAFLMYNSAFEIIFFPGLFVQGCGELIDRHWPAARTDAGGGIWLRRR